MIERRVRKPFKNISEQVTILESKKQIVVSNRESAKAYLLRHNYYNVISCGKVKFAVDIIKGVHEYEQHHFDEWISYYESDLALSRLIVGKIMDLEGEINAKLAYYLSEMIDLGCLTDELKVSIQSILNNDINNQDKNYVLDETWVFVTKATFGTVVKLLEKLDPAIQKKIYPKSFNMKMIKELKNLRNNLFHLTPINIYLTSNSRTNHKNKLRRMQLLKKLLPDNGDLNDLINNAQKFNSLKSKKKNPTH